MIIKGSYYNRIDSIVNGRINRPGKITTDLTRYIFKMLGKNMFKLWFSNIFETFTCFKASLKMLY